MQISGFVKTTLLDYPGHLAATVFVSGCNYNCSYCHNSELIPPANKSLYKEEQIIQTLLKRHNILEGICISGGEPTLQADLPTFISKIKSLGYKVKLDTNGSNPSMIEHLLANHLLDYIAMDIKNSKEEYAHTCGIPSINISNIENTVDLIQNSSIPYEFRTTLVKEFHTSDDIYSIGRWLIGSNAYYLQSYKESDMVRDKTLHALDQQTILQFQQILKAFIPNTQIRGID